jgi:carnitine-CoA ligase
VEEKASVSSSNIKPVPLLNGVNQRTVPWLLSQQALARKGHPFIVWAPFAGPPTSLTYGEFYQRTIEVAAGLRERGVGRGDVVLLHMDNCPEFLLVWHACAQLGVVVVTTNTRSSSDELRYFIDHCGARVAITQPAYLGILAETGADLRWVASIDHNGGEPALVVGDAIRFSDLSADAADFVPADSDPFDYNSVQYTSGTTSRPKGVVWTHANAVNAARSNARVCGLNKDDVGHAFLPLFHTNALSYSHLATLWAGATLVLQPRFSASRYWDCVIAHRCTWGIHIPFSLKALFKQPIPDQHFFTRWGLGAHDPAIVRQLTGVPCIGWFGMTETVTLPIFSDLSFPAREMSMGMPSPEYEVEVRNENGSHSPWGESGRLWIRGIPGLTLFHSYLNNPEATARAFDDNGWFDTGDMVTATADGFITFNGRSGDMLRVGAENVAESEIERVIGEFPQVQDVAVVSKPHDMLDEVPVAFVEAPEVGDAQGQSDFIERLLAHCRQRLADFKVPHEIVVVDHIPRVTLEKYDKKLLRKRLRDTYEDQTRGNN